MNAGERAMNDLLVAGCDDDPGACLEPEVWITADEQEIAYCDLTHGHLAAIIKMINRELLAVHTGGWPQGEQAAWHLESLVSQREGELEDLEAEQARRREAQFPS